jgi:putative membrane protein
MMLWLVGLPFAYLPFVGLWSIIICAVVSYQVLGFEDIGVEIEQPFGNDYNDIPMDQLGQVLYDQLHSIHRRIESGASGHVKP